MRTFPGKCVLIVDDMKLARLRVRKVCEDMGFYPISEAASGAEAWQGIGDLRVKPDLILTDYNMPDMNGIQFLERVRKHEEISGVPVIFITSEGEKELIITAVSLGVTDFVVKPFADHLLVEKIQSVMTRKK